MAAILSRLQCVKTCSGLKKGSKMAEANEAKTAYIDAKRVVKDAI